MKVQVFVTDHCKPCEALVAQLPALAKVVGFEYEVIDITPLIGDLQPSGPYTHKREGESDVVVTTVPMVTFGQHRHTGFMLDDMKPLIADLERWKATV